MAESHPSYIFEHRNDLHKVLGLPKSASDVDIKRAYRRLALKYHPDKFQKDSSPHSEHDHSEAFRIICKAHEVLTDVNKRRIYELGGMEKVEESDLRGDVVMPTFVEAVKMVSLVCLVFATREGFRNIKRSGGAKGEGDVPIGDADSRRRSRNMFREEQQFSYTALKSAHRWTLMFLVLAIFLSLVISFASSVNGCEGGMGSCIFRTLLKPLRGDTVRERVHQAKVREMVSLASGSTKRSIISESNPALYCDVVSAPEAVAMYTFEQARWMISSSPTIESSRVSIPILSSGYSTAAGNISLLKIPKCGLSHGPYRSQDGVPFYSFTQLSQIEQGNVMVENARIRWVGAHYCDSLEVPSVEASLLRFQANQYSRRWESEVKICKDEGCKYMKRRPIRLRRQPSTVADERHLLTRSPFCAWWSTRNILPQ